MLKKVNDFKLPKEFKVEPNLNLLAQAVRVYEERSHTGLRKTKTRAEVNKTGRKLYKQKGTGGARHGSKRAPIFVGGGIAHGPRPVRRVLSLPARMRALAKRMALSLKIKNKEVIVVEGLGKASKTKDVAKFLDKVGGKRFTLVVDKPNKALGNIKNAQMVLFKDVNAWQIIKGGIILVDKAIFVKVKK